MKIIAVAFRLSKAASRRNTTIAITACSKGRIQLTTAALIRNTTGRDRGITHRGIQTAVRTITVVRLLPTPLPAVAAQDRVHGQVHRPAEEEEEGIKP